VAVPAGLESIGASAAYSDAAIYRSHLFIGGPGGLAEYDSAGAPLHRFRAGIELPPAPITSLAVGVAGELWLGTASEGLAAFDGHTFRHIRPDNAARAKITAMLAAPTGRILLGTGKAGVLVWDGQNLREFHPAVTGVSVTALAGDDSDLWVGTLDRGLLHWRAGAIQPLTGTLPDVRVLSLAISGDTAYAGMALGIAEIRGNSVTRTLAPGYLAQPLYAEMGKLWMGTLEEGMRTIPLEIRPGRGAELGTSTVCGDCAIRKIFRVGGDLYTLTENSLWRSGEAVLRPDSPALRDRNISALATDSTGRLWVGYFDKGIQVLSAGGGRGAEIEDDRLFCINRIVHDGSRGVSAVATANGLVLMDSFVVRRRVLTRADGLIANQITDVALRPDGTMVAATPAGVSFIGPQGISSVYAFQGLVNNHVYSLALDEGRVLAGTLGGLSILENGFVKASYTTANSSLRHNWITALVRMGRDVFAGTYGAGVLKLDAIGHWETFEDLPGGLEIKPTPWRLLRARSMPARWIADWRFTASLPDVGISSHRACHRAT
jgi:ligand-binding sensor domain-containing protein